MVLTEIDDCLIVMVENFGEHNPLTAIQMALAGEKYGSRKG